MFLELDGIVAEVKEMKLNSVLHLDGIVLIVLNSAFVTQKATIGPTINVKQGLI